MYYLVLLRLFHCKLHLFSQQNDQGLVYVEVEFPQNKTKPKKGKNKKAKKNQGVYKSDESVNYSDIDFTKTDEKRRELERAEGEQGVGSEEEEPLNDVYENTEWKNRYPDAGFGIGTTV